MKTSFTLLFTLFISLFSFAGGISYNGPESVAYDAATNTYFVSNTGGFITKQEVGGVLTTFTSATSSPYGIEVMNGVLYACDNGRIKGYSISTGAEVFNLNVGGTFLNGMTTDGSNFIYVTDFSGQNIKKIDVANSSYTTFVSNTGGTPNGIKYDGANNRLVFVSWGMNASIKGVSLSDSTVTTLKTTTLGNMDGIDQDCMGNWYVSTWSPERITLFSNDFSIEQTISTPQLSSPADIYFNPITDTLVVPNSGSDIVRYTLESVEKANLLLPFNPAIEQTVQSGSGTSELVKFTLRYPCGTSTFDDLTVDVVGDYGTNLSNFRLVSSDDNSYSTSGDNTVLATGTENGSTIDFTGLNSTVSNIQTYYFVVADVANTVDESEFATFSFSSGDVAFSSGVTFGDDATSNVINFMNAMTPINSVNTNRSMDAHPNPFSDIFEINLPEDINDGEIIVTNILGKIIYREYVEGTAVISAKTWPTGVYLVQAPDVKGIHTLRIIKR